MPKNTSPLSLNNFNILLKQLDEKQQVSNDTTTITNCSVLSKEVMDTFIHNVNMSYNLYEYSVLTPSFYSIHKLPSTNSSDPNQYIDAKPYVKRVTKEIKKIITKEKINVDATINNIDDLLQLINNYKLDDTIEYNINMNALHNIKEPLTNLNNMIGMTNLKENVVDQILYFIQNLHINPQQKLEAAKGEFLHTVIYGPPGTGKTEVAKIIGHIFSKLGILQKGTFKKVTRSDLIAGYLGQTAIKTQDVIKECLGGVLFIDEAYALGNSEKRDNFSKECIDTLCEALSDHKENLMVIIAGYEKELDDCFFNYNQGLNSRFIWRFKIDEYKAEELYKIFIKKVTEYGWSVNDNINVNWFQKHMDYFKYYGRDIETLLLKTKIAHGRRVFCKSREDRYKLTLKDLENGFDMYIKNEEVKNRKEFANKANIMNSLYV